METAGLLAAIGSNSGLVARAARTAPDAPVRACGAWRAADVLWHLGEVHRFWNAAVEAGGPAPATTRGARAAAQVDAVTWFEEGASMLVRTLADAPHGISSGPPECARRSMPDSRATASTSSCT